MEKLADAADEAALCWQDKTSSMAKRNQLTLLAGQSTDAVTHVLTSLLKTADGEGDPEHPAATQGKVLRVQAMVTNALDANVRDSMRKHLEDSENHPATRRLDELCHKDMSHSWLWHLSKHRGLVFSNEEFLEAVRIRLGCAGPTEPVPCSRCGALLDCAASHAACCAIGESTRGHYGVVKQLLPRVLQCDPTAETEVPNLIPGSACRYPHPSFGQLPHRPGRGHHVA